MNTQKRGRAAARTATRPVTQPTASGKATFHSTHTSHRAVAVAPEDVYYVWRYRAVSQRQLRDTALGALASVIVAVYVLAALFLASLGTLGCLSAIVVTLAVSGVIFALEAGRER